MDFLKISRWLATFLVIVLPCRSQAQKNESYEYERASLCMMLEKHPAKKFAREIEYVFRKMPLPKRFNSHELGVRTVAFASQKNGEDKVASFIKQENIGKRLVSKWFLRDKKTGFMDMSLIRQRGLYAATKAQTNIARKQMRGLAMLEDAGELLLSNTYLVVCDINYIDRSVGANVFKDWANFTTNLAQTGKGKRQDVDSSNPFEASELAAVNGVLDDLKGFKVKIRSYLFRLDWNDDIANQFYNLYYIDSSVQDKSRKTAFENDNELFSMTYVGVVENSSQNISLCGVTTNEQLITKVCTRALDKNIAELQHNHKDFRIKAPLVSVSPLTAYVGMKEDFTEKSLFEVLERSVDKEGRVKYKRVGTIKPVNGKIWDNRFMADLEGTVEAALGHTEFVKVSGGTFYPGMLIREIK